MQIILSIFLGSATALFVFCILCCLKVAGDYDKKE